MDESLQETLIRCAIGQVITDAEITLNEITLQARGSHGHQPIDEVQAGQNGDDQEPPPEEPEMQRIYIRGDDMRIILYMATNLGFEKRSSL